LARLVFQNRVGLPAVLLARACYNTPQLFFEEQTTMEFPRASGVLLHITSLPGPYGIGDFGPAAYAFADFLKITGQSLWQVLPLCPTSFGDSPYQSTSSFAGNPLLIDLDALKTLGWLREEDLPPSADFNDYVVNYGPVIEYHLEALTQAYVTFQEQGTPAQKEAYRAFCSANAAWLDDYALFAALKDSHDGKPWWQWPQGQALREAEEIQAARQGLDDSIHSHMFRQWVFFEQWAKLRAYINGLGIRVIGDLPIFVAHDSADVWASQRLFALDEKGLPTVVAGVPPDFFSETGQLWGNPLFRWDVMAAEGYAWWKARLRAALTLYDIVRIDHFRGFADYWEIPAGEENAVNGRWVDGPGEAFFEAMREEFGDLPIIVEDLGDNPAKPFALRDKLGLPGMKILQFGFDDTCRPNPFHIHTFPVNCVVYTGTHDNNTTLGWWHEVSDGVRNCVRAYMGPVYDPPRDLMRLGMMSVAHTFIAPLQDVLAYGADTRMNTPSTQGANWAWRFKLEALSEEIRFILGDMTYRYGRHPDSRDLQNQTLR
jgi:4-alpha-glucanotransferase